MTSKNLKKDLEYHKNWIRQFLKESLVRYFNDPNNGYYPSTIDYLSENIEHAIDHIISDHCDDE